MIIMNLIQCKILKKTYYSINLDFFHINKFNKNKIRQFLNKMNNN